MNLSSVDSKLLLLLLLNGNFAVYGNQGEGRRQGREVSLAGVGWRAGENMQTTVIEQQ